MPNFADIITTQWSFSCFTTHFKPSTRFNERNNQYIQKKSAIAYYEVHHLFFLVSFLSMLMHSSFSPSYFHTFFGCCNFMHGNHVLKRPFIKFLLSFLLHEWIFLFFIRSQKVITLKKKCCHVQYFQNIGYSITTSRHRLL